MTFNNITDGDPGLAAPVMQNFKHINYGSALLPVNASGVSVDSTIDFGSSTKYFKDGYIDTLSTTGNVGFGTDSPDTYSYGANFKIATVRNESPALTAVLQVVSNGTAGAFLDFGNESIRRALIRGENGSDLTFHTNSTNSGSSVTERARFLSNGNFGVGVDDPDSIIESWGTGTNFKGSYDDSNYFTLDCDSVGDLTITASGGDISFGDENLLTTGTLGAGDITGTGTLTVNDNIFFTDSGTGVSLDFERTDTHGASAFIALFDFYGRDASANKKQYAGIDVLSTDNTFNSVDGKIEFQVATNNVNTSAFELSGSGSYLGSPTMQAKFTANTIGNFVSGFTVGTDQDANHIDDASRAAAGTSTVMYIGGNTIDTTNPSDMRLKTNIKPLEKGLSELNKLETVEFDFIDSEVHGAGMIAQEVQKIFPEYVKKRSDKYLMIEYKELIPVMIKSIQELSNKIEELEKK